MKRLITTCLLLLSLGIGAQNLEETDIDQAIGSINFDSSDEDNSSTNVISISETFEEAAKRNAIPYRSFEGLQGVEDGYYVIMGVFNEGKNLKRAVKKLKKKDFDAGAILNPENNLNYVYLQHFPFGLEAVDAVVSQFDGEYNDDVWILSVENSLPIQESSLNDTNGAASDSKPVSVNEVT